MEYAFIHKKTKKIVRHDLRMSDYDAFKKKHPNLERYHDSAPAVTYNGRTFRSLDAQTDNGWKEVLSKIAEKNKGSQLANDYGRKSIKESKTHEVVQKHAKKRIAAEKAAKKR